MHAGNLERELRPLPLLRLARLRHERPRRVVERELYLPRRRRRPAQRDAQLPVTIVMHGHSMDEEILDVLRGLRLEPHRAEQPAEPPEILILQPAPAREPHDRNSELVLPRRELLRDIERCRRERILAVADVVPVQIDDERRLRPLECHAHALPLPALGQREIAHIGADGVLPHGDLPRRHALMPVPGIRHVRVLRAPVSLELPVRGHADRLPAAAVVRRRLEALRAQRQIPRIVEIPNAVEPQGVRALPARELCLIPIPAVIAVRGQAVLSEKCRLPQLSPIERFLHDVPPTSLLQLSGSHGQSRRTTALPRSKRNRRQCFFKKGRLITLMGQPSQTSYYLLILSQVSSSFATIRACSASVSVTFAR